MVIERISSRVPPVVAIALAVFILAGAIVLDFVTPAHFNPSILYAPALVMAGLLRSKRVLWAAAIVMIFLTLAAGLSQDETMDRICGALSQLVNQQTVASAILEREGDEVKVRCHYGFGRSGLERERWPLDQSFTHLIMEANKTGSLEDISLR